MRDNRETDMIDIWCKVSEFHYRTKQNNIIRCLRCFAELIFLENSD